MCLDEDKLTCSQVRLHQTVSQINAITQILTPHMMVTSERILIKLETKNYHPKTTNHTKLYLHPMMWVVWTNTQLFGFFCFFFDFLVARTGSTNGPILMIYTSYYLFPRRDVPFGGCVDTTPHLWVNRLKTRILEAWIGISQPNLRNI